MMNLNPSPLGTQRQSAETFLKVRLPGMELTGFGSASKITAPPPPPKEDDDLDAPKGEPSRLELPPAHSQPAEADRQELIAAIKQDPEIQKALGNWGSLSTEEKLAVGDMISEKMGGILGFEETENLLRGDQLAKPGQMSTTGLWSFDGQASKIELSDRSLADPAEFLETLVHEQIHQRDHVLGLPTEPHQHGDHVYDFAGRIKQGVFA